MPRRLRKNQNDDENETSNSTTSNPNPNPKRRKRNDLAVMHASDQTDAERRALRHSQRELAKSIHTMEGIEDVHSGKFDEVRDLNNELWENVRYTREAVLDGDNLEMIGSRASRQVDKLISVPRYDADRLVAKLRAKCYRQDDGGSGGIDWRVLGLEVGSCFNAIPSRVSFLAGPIQAAKDYRPNIRKKTIRRSAEEDDAEEEEPDEVHQKSKNKKDEDKLSAVEYQMKVMQKLLKKKCELEKKRNFAAICDDHGVESIEELDNDARKSAHKKLKAMKADTTCLVKFLFNPKSFTQTVENLFNLSFMVKHNRAEVGVRSLEDCKALGVEKDREDPSIPLPGPYVKVRKDPEGEKRNVGPPKQAVVAFDMRVSIVLYFSYISIMCDFNFNFIPN